MSLSDIHQNLVDRLEALGQGFSADVNLKLERIEHLLALLGQPQKQFKTIHVGGTSGKGSVSTMIMQLLETAGYKTGLFTSPYLQVINESCLIGGALVDISFFHDLMDELEPKIRQVGEEGGFGAPSYFEALLALSLLAFARNDIDIAILEVGLGGKLDATNIVQADVSVLTSVGLDHIEILGTTIEDIASDKVQIMKPGQIVVCGFLQKSAQKIARQYSAEVGADFKQIGVDFSYKSDADGCLSILTERQVYEGIQTDFRAGFQRHNVALSIRVCEEFSKFDKLLIEEGLSKVSLPGRNELLSERPLVIIDGAHNPPKLQAALEVIAPKILQRKTVVLYASKRATARNPEVQKLLDERQKEIFNLLSGIGAERVIFTEFHTKGIWHAEAADFLASQYEENCDQGAVEVLKSPLEALIRARELVGPEGCVLALGSFHLAGEIRSEYYPISDLLQNFAGGS